MTESVNPPVTSSPRIPDHHRLLEVIAFQSEIFATSADRLRTVQLACDRAQSIVAADGAVIDQPAAGTVARVVCSESLAEHSGMWPSAMRQMSDLSAATGEMMICADSEVDPRVDGDACRRMGLRSMVCVPLRHAGTTVGVLTCVSSRPSAFDDTDLALARLVGGVVATAMAQAELIERLRGEATVDVLTGLANRRVWDRELEAALARATRGQRTVTVCLFDLDGFKDINDIHGHEAGDAVLRHVAEQWSGVVRTGELLSRIGGDEFAVLLEDASATSVAALAGRLRKSIASTCAMSIGTAVSGHGDDVQSLMRRADEAMYADKAARNLIAPRQLSSVARQSAARRRALGAGRPGH